MCGRFALATEKNILDMLYDLEIRTGFNLVPRYNIAPSQQVPVVRLSPVDGRRELALLKWGLVPFWADDPTIGSKMINARAETVADKPSFRDAFKKRRALVPASGFYEWKKTDSSKQPYYITTKGNRPFSLAGLWETWNKGSETLETFTILTTDPNPLVAELHNRMPVIIPQEGYKLWLAPAADPAALKSMLAPYPKGELQFYPVSPLVNNPSNDNPGLIEPL
jgi:putative SOS response-associated peptidase YedK